MASWKVIAALLADRLTETEGVSGGCPAHGREAWREHYLECPHCHDVQAYQAYLKAGGHDFRQPACRGKTISVEEIMKGKER